MSSPDYPSENWSKTLHVNLWRKPRETGRDGERPDGPHVVLGAVSVDAGGVLTALSIGSGLHQRRVIGAKFGELHLVASQQSGSPLENDKFASLVRGAGGGLQIEAASTHLTGALSVDGTINGQLPLGSIGSVQLADASVVEQKLSNGSVTRDKIRAGSVGETQLADNAVTSNKLAGACVGNLNIQSQAVDNGALANDAVTNSKIRDNSVSTDKLTDNAVTEAKLADDSVGANKIQAGAIHESELADRAVTGRKIDAGAVETQHIAISFLARIVDLERKVRELGDARFVNWSSPFCTGYGDQLCENNASAVRRTILSGTNEMTIQLFFDGSNYPDDSLSSMPQLEFELFPQGVRIQVGKGESRVVTATTIRVVGPQDSVGNTTYGGVWRATGRYALLTR